MNIDEHGLTTLKQQEPSTFLQHHDLHPATVTGAQERRDFLEEGNAVRASIGNERKKPGASGGAEAVLQGFTSSWGWSSPGPEVHGPVFVAHPGRPPVVKDD